MQTSLEDQPVAARQMTSFSATFTLPSSLLPGKYIVKAGVFAPGGGLQYDWSDSAGAFVVDTPPPTPPPAPAAPAPDDTVLQPDGSDTTD